MKRLILLLLLVAPCLACSQSPPQKKIQLQGIKAKPHVWIFTDFPEVFETGAIPDAYKELDEDDLKAALCADALEAWGLVMSGQKQPHLFGYGMYLVGERLKIIATPENLMKYAESLKE